MRRVKPRHHHAPLALPDLAVGAKHAQRQFHFQPDFFKARSAFKARRPVPQNRSNEFMVSDRQQSSIANLQFKQRAKLKAPLLELLVKAGYVKLQRIAQPRNAARTRQLVEAAQRLW